jgi:hypothetical protein
MTNSRPDSKLFEEMTRELLARGLSVRFQAQGGSMFPTICGGEIVEIAPVGARKLRKGDIVLARCSYGFRLHRLIVANHAADLYITRGDFLKENDPALKEAQILGIAQSKQVCLGRKLIMASFRRVDGWALRAAARAQIVLRNLYTRILQSQKICHN